MHKPRHIGLFAALGETRNAAKWAYVQQLREDLAVRRCRLFSFDLLGVLNDPARDVHPFRAGGDGPAAPLPAGLAALGEAARWHAQMRGREPGRAREQVESFAGKALHALRHHRIACCVLWNQFTPMNHALAAVCEAEGIEVKYAHLGLLSGTIVFEGGGQMAESGVARDPAAFSAFPLTGVQRENARRYLARARSEKWTRKPQGEAGDVAEALRPHVEAGRTIVFYAGQNDFASGMVPADLPRARVHSPHFTTTEAALRALAEAAERHHWTVLFKPHPSMAAAVDDPGAWALDHVVTLPDANVFACIEAAAVTVTILSQVAYLALIQQKPTVLLGRMQLSGTGCLYELPAPGAVAGTVAQAIREGYTRAQRDAFEAHVARLFAYYLSPLDEEMAGFMGVLRADGANQLAFWAEKDGDDFVFTSTHEYSPPDVPRAIGALMAGCTRQQKKYRHYLERTAWRVTADYRTLWRHTAFSGVDSALDIGAVPPLLAALLREEMPTVAVAGPGADAFAPYCARHGIEWANADVLRDDDPYPGREFGLVCFCEVLEHLTGDVPAALERVIAKVQPGGLLYVTTPNLRSISGLAGLLRHHTGIPSKWRESVRDQYARAGGKDGYTGHVREYTAREVIALFESFGLRHVASAYQTHPRAETLGRKAIWLAETLLPRWRLYGKYLFRH